MKPGLIDHPNDAQHSDHQQLWGIGCVRVLAGDLPYPVSWRDVDADAYWAGQLLRALGVGQGNFIHLCHTYSDLAQMWGYYQAARNIGAVFANGMPTPYDAYRMEMYLRRFKLSAAIGVCADTLDGLQQGGHDLVRLYANAGAIVALPGACERLGELGFKPWRLLRLGPLHAVEAPDRSGARFDNREWRVESVDGRLLVSAAPQRACAFERLDVGLRGEIASVNGEAGPEWRIFAE